jgi:hypothetical protein
MAKYTIELGKGARFWAYISPQNNTAKNVTDWSVTITQQGGNWTGTITSVNPQENLQTPGLSGVFDVVVRASGPNMPAQDLHPQAGTNPNVGCNSNCVAMVGIVSTDPEGTGAEYWTVWNAYCPG